MHLAGNTQRLYAPVTVIIPCWRSKYTIKRAISSVRNQSLRPKQVIVIEDGSQDGTYELLQTLQAEFDSEWLKVIRLDENQGPGVARNTGWDHATTALIAFLDADDAWHPQKIEIQSAYMLAHPEVALSGHDHKIVTDQADNNWSLDRLRANTIKKQNLLLKNQFTTPSIMVRQTLNYRFHPTKRYVDDHLLWLQMACDKQVLIKIELPLVAVYKSMYGASGLSAALWKMEKSELDNYWTLFQARKINGLIMTGCISLSLLKFFKRVMVVGLRKVRLIFP